MDKKHIAIGIGVITFVGITLTIILIWMMNYQSDVVMSPSPPAQSFRWQSLKPNVLEPTDSDTVESFTAEVPEDTTQELPETTDSEVIAPPKKTVLEQEEEMTEPSSAVPVEVPEQPKIPWSQLNKSLLALEQEQAAIMTLLAQKYSSAVVESTTQVVKPATQGVESQPKTVEIKPQIPKTATIPVEKITSPPKIVEIEPETPKTVATPTEIVATTQPIKPEAHSLTTTEIAQLTPWLDKKPLAKPLELTWETDLFINLNSNSWLKVVQQIFELEQWREKTIRSLTNKVNRQSNQEDNQ